MPKKKKQKSKQKVDVAPMMDKTVRVERIANGYIIQSYTKNGEKKVYSKTTKEAEKYMKSFLR